MAPRIARPASSPIASPIAPSTWVVMIVIRNAITIAPKTDQPLPLTSSRLRPNAPITPSPSTTIDGEITAQIVSRIRPGTISRMKPMPIAMPARIPFRISGTEIGRRGGEELADALVAAAVAHVLHELHYVTGVEEREREGDDASQQHQDQAAGRRQQADDERRDPDQDHRSAEQRSRVLAIGLERLADHAARVDVPTPLTCGPVASICSSVRRGPRGRAPGEQVITSGRGWKGRIRAPPRRGACKRELHSATNGD